MKAMLGALLIACISSAAVSASGQATPLKKSAPAGVYSLMSGDRADRPVRNLANQNAWTNPAVEGFALRTFWDKIEPAKGEYDWSHFDEGVALAREHGKRVGLSVAGGMATPEWAYETGIERFPFHLQTNFGPSGERTMPKPWDSAFQKEWGTFVRAMAARYDGDPAVAYVHMSGLGFSTEPYFIKAQEDLPAFEAAGGLASYIAGGKALVDLYAESFPQTVFILSLSNAIPGAEGAEAVEEIARFGLEKYPGRMGLMNHGLNAESKREFFANELICRNSLNAPAGYQMVWSTSGENARLLKGTLEEALARGIEMRAQFIEVYGGDCNDPQYQNVIETANNGLKLNAQRFEEERAKTAPQGAGHGSR